MAIHQLAGLGIRNRLVRIIIWISASVLAAVLAAASIIAAFVPYVVLVLFTIWRLTEPR